MTNEICEKGYDGQLIPDWFKWPSYTTEGSDWGTKRGRVKRIVSG